MKITIDNTGISKNKPYPKLMKSNMCSIVLFDKAGCGTLLEGDGYYAVGLYRTDWCEGNFVDFNGSVTISND